MVGEVIIHFNDGTEEKFDDQYAFNRLIPEFIAFVQAINTNDYKHCYQKLDESINVSEIMTKARIEAGIVFPCDK